MRGVIAALVVVSASAGAAFASPPSSCRDLAAPPFAQLPAAARAKLLGGEGYETNRAAKFAKLEITVVIARGPHLVRDILLACPGAIDVVDVASGDPRHFASTVRMHVKSFATLARMIQMPSVAYVSIYDPTIIRPMIPEPIRDFE